MQIIAATFCVESIENGFVVRHEEAARAVYVRYEFEVARTIERLMHDEAELCLARDKDLSSDAFAKAEPRASEECAV